MTARRNKSGALDLTAAVAIENVMQAEKKLKATEAQEQAAVFDWAELHRNHYPELRLMHHIPNGGSRHPAEAKKLKRQGVKPGVPDICLPVARMGFHGLYIEMKTIGGRIRNTQAEWINDLRKQDYAAFVCYGATEAIEILEWHLGDNP